MSIYLLCYTRTIHRLWKFANSPHPALHEFVIICAEIEQTYFFIIEKIYLNTRDIMVLRTISYNRDLQTMTIKI